MMWSKLLCLAPFLIFMGCSSSTLDPSLPERSYLEQAQYQRQNGNIDGAIIQYRYYISERLKTWDRLHEEDPNYYLITIGDLLFDAKRDDHAYCVYWEAEQKGVNKNLIVDRYVRLAHWYQSIRRFATSDELLRKHSFLDQLVFQGELNRSFQAHRNAEDSTKTKISLAAGSLPTQGECDKIMRSTRIEF